jgi:hypothetical protein
VEADLAIDISQVPLAEAVELVLGVLGDLS